MVKTTIETLVLVLIFAIVSKFATCSPVKRKTEKTPYFKPMVNGLE